MAAPLTSIHYAANGNFVGSTYAPGSVGFNLADVSSLDQLNSLPANVKGLVYLGATGGDTASFESQVSQYIGNPKLYGFYITDDPNPAQVPAANIKAEADWISAHVPGAVTFLTVQNLGSDTNPSYAGGYNPANTDVQLFGIAAYPVKATGTPDYSIIPGIVSAAERAGIPQSQIVPIYQAFGGGGYSNWGLPTASQEQQILSTWGNVIPNPTFDYAYSWGTQLNDGAISTSSALQQVFVSHNGAGAPTLSLQSTNITVAAGGAAPLGISMSAPASDARLTISNLPRYETITDAADGKSFSGNVINLSIQEVNSGLTVHSRYTGSGHPSATLSLRASDTVDGQTYTAPTQYLTVVDPPAGVSSTNGTPDPGGGEGEWATGSANLSDSVAASSDLGTYLLQLANDGASADLTSGSHRNDPPWLASHDDSAQGRHLSAYDESATGQKRW